MKRIKKALLLVTAFAMSACMFTGCSFLEGLLPSDSTESSVELPATSEEPGASEEPGTSEEPEVVKYGLTVVTNPTDRMNGFTFSELEAGEAIVLPEVEDVEGKTFEGWVVISYDEETGEEIQSAPPATMPETDLVVYAKWKLQTKQIIVTKLDGSTVSYTIAVEDNYDDLENPIFAMKPNAFGVISIEWQLENDLSAPTVEGAVVSYQGIPETWALKNYTLIEVQHEHTYDVAAYDESAHWMGCACGAKDEATVAGHGLTVDGDATGHWKTCSGCEYISEVEAHNAEFGVDYWPVYENGVATGKHTGNAGCCGAQVLEEDCDLRWIAYESPKYAGEGALLGDTLICDKCTDLSNRDLPVTFKTKNSDGEGLNAQAKTLELNIEKVGEFSNDTFDLGSLLGDYVKGQTITQVKGLYFNGVAADVEIPLNVLDFNTITPVPYSIFGYAWGDQVLELVVTSGEGALEKDHTIKIKLSLVTNVIETKEELDNFLAVAKECGDKEAKTYGGHFKLGANIVYNANAENLPEAKTAATLPNLWNAGFSYADFTETVDGKKVYTGGGFVGIFDGAGYSIDGLVTYEGEINRSTGAMGTAFIPVIAEGGVLKSVYFTNAYVGSGAMVTEFNMGTVEKLYIQVACFGIYYNTQWNMFKYFNPGMSGTELGFFNNEWGATGTISSVFIDLTESAKKTYIETGKNEGESWLNDYSIDANFAGNASYNEAFYGLGKGQTTTYNGVYLVGFPTTANISNKAYFTDDMTKVYIFSNMDEYTAAYYDDGSVLKETMDGWAKLLRAYAIPAQQFEQVKELYLDIQYVDGVVSVNEDRTVTINFGEAGSDVQHGSSLSWYVFYKGERITNFSYSTAKSFRVPASLFGLTYGEDEITIVTNGGKYIIPLELVSKYISTADELDAMNYIAAALESDPNTYGGNFRLTDNIEYNKEYIPMMDISIGRAINYNALADVVADADGYATYHGRYLICNSKLVKAADLANATKEADNWSRFGWNGDASTVMLNGVRVYVSNSTSKGVMAWNALANTGFVGTFNGQGYYIKGMKFGGDISYAAFMPKLGSTAVIKNVAFVDVEYTANGSTGGVLSITTADGSLIENVYVKVKSFGTGLNSATVTTDDTRGLNGATLRNVLVDTSEAVRASNQVVALGGAYNTNSAKIAPYLIYDGAYAIVNNQTQYDNAYGIAGVHADSKDYGVYMSAADMLADSATYTELMTWIGSASVETWIYDEATGYFGWHSLVPPPPSGDCKHEFGKDGICISCGAYEICVTKGHAYGKDGACENCGAYEACVNGKHPYGKDGACEFCGVYEACVNGKHAYGKDGACEFCGAYEACVNGKHPYGKDGVCELCGAKEPVKCEKHDFGKDGVCIVCGEKQEVVDGGR